MGKRHQQNIAFFIFIFYFPLVIYSQNVELPKEYLSTCMPSTKVTVTVCNAGCDYNNNQLQLALDNAPAGSLIILEAGINYTGNFLLTEKSGDEWTIITSSELISLPPQGTRVNPSHAHYMPKLLSPNNLGALSCGKRAHHFRLVGLEVAVAASALGDANNGGTANTGLVRFGDYYETKLSDQGHYFILDRCYVHGDPKKNTRRGLHINSGYTAVIDSYLSEFHEIGADAQALVILNGPGPFKIVNNYMEASGENMIVGGADPSIYNLVPADIEIRGNYMYKPLSWWTLHPSYGGYHWTVKNCFELKYGRRILVDGNIFENNWVDGQTGTAINIKTANQDGNNPLAVTEHLTFSNNIVKHAGSALSISGKDQGVSLITNHVSVYNNLFDDINGVKYGGANGHFILPGTGANNISLDHNTSTQDGSILIIDSQCPDFIFTNNITRHNQYGIKGGGTAAGNSTISTYLPNALFENNVMVGAGSNYPVNNYYPNTIQDVGFINFNNGDGGDYHLAASSPYKNAGTDGEDVGANIDSILVKTATVITGITSDCSVTTSSESLINSLNKIEIIPNPSSQYFRVLLTLKKSNIIDISVYNITGKKVLDLYRSQFLNEGVYTMESSILIPGIYFIRAKTGIEIITRKLIIIGN